MPSNRRQQITLLALAAALLFPAAASAELGTLFTTPEERQIINANRYKSDETRSRPVEPEQQVDKMPIRQLVMQEVTHAYTVSGITLSSEGPHWVWINSTRYQDGAILEQGGRVKVLDGDEVRLRITAPDGRSYYAKSGETVEISYQVPMEN